ncbi:MAG: hypothetical protein AMS22_08380 [Thiotrichales bacterium SG8_50]|nr:MAG: hypothetical protein AMS22_08380 [Thiotrichales bacterium SG8_50]
MNWRRVHEEGRDPEHWKQWRSGPYRIIWRDMVCSVNVPPAFQPCVRVKVPDLMYDRWELLDHRKPLYRTLNAAKVACEQHKDPNYRPPRKKKRKTK